MDSLTDFTNSLFNNLFFLSFFGLVCIVLQKISPSIPAQKNYRAEFLTDLYFWFLLFVTSFLVTSPTIIHFIKPLEYSGLLNLPLTDMNYYLKIVLAIICVDFTGYWIHRLFHSKYLWRFHAIHHSPLEIDWLCSARFHPVESVVVITGLYIAGIIIVGFSFIEVTTAITIRSWYGYIVHSNLSWHYGKAGRVVASPFFHRWHHTTQKEGLNKNFAGVFAIWDYFFGTAHNPHGKQPSQFGIGHKIGDNLWDYVKYPFVK